MTESTHEPTTEANTKANIEVNRQFETKKLNVAILSIEYPPDPFSAGIGSYTKAIANALTAQGHRVHIITRAPAIEVNAVLPVDSVIDEDGVIVHRLTPLRPEIPEEFDLKKVLALVSSSVIGELRYRHKISRTLQKLINTEGLDLIEAAEFMADGIFYPRRHNAKIPFIVRLHTPFAFAEKIEAHAPEPMRQLMAWLEKQHINKASHLSAPSGRSAEVFREELQLGNRTIEIIPNPPNFQVLEDSENRHQAVKSDETSGHLVLFIGRISKWKGVDVLCRSMAQVLENHPKTQFCFVGADHIPVEGFPTGREYLKSLVAEQFHAHMTFTGYLQKPEVQKHIRMADLCVLPSRFDNFPYTCLEAMIHGKAVIGSNNGGMKDMLADGAAGRLYTPPDHDELAQHIVELLNDRDQREALGKAARARALESYSNDVVLEQTLAFYHQAIESCNAT